jgi:predicted nucleotidyltransferase
MRAEWQEAVMRLPSDVAEIVESLQSGAQEALGANLIALYLRGSLVAGDFDPDASDIDFFAVTERRLSEREFAALEAVHARFERLPNRYGDQLEGPYMDHETARRFRHGERHPTIARNEPLLWREHYSNWVFERWTLRASGIALYGPEPQALIDPVSSDAILAAVRSNMTRWVKWINDPDDPDWLLPRGHKAYVVETMCRILYTLATGELAGKPQSVAWALETLPVPWRATVERSQVWRNDQTVDLSIALEVRAFVLWTATQAHST